MRFSHIAVIYFMMGVVVVGTGAVPYAELGIGEVFIDVQGQDVSVDDESIVGSGDGGGMITNLIGPVANALNTITGGALMAVWGPISTMSGAYAWPLVTANHLDAPRIVVMFSGVLVASFTFGILRVFRASI
jgi:hypothetical protein